MNNKLRAILSIPTVALTLWSVATPSDAQTAKVWLDTTHGPILLALDEERAPITTENFLNYVDEGFYDGLIFHRVIEGFIIQSGGYDDQLQAVSPTQPTIKSEASNGLLNRPYTIAMGLVGGDVDSAQSQFYINMVDNDHLDEAYTVFGEVVGGQATVDRINQLFTTTTDVPLEIPRIRRATRYTDYPLMPLHTGSWYNEATSGTGFNLEITLNASNETGPLAIVYWYDFRDGEQIWLTGVKAFEWGDHEVTLDLITATSPVADADFRQPPEGEAFETWGTVTVSFDDCQRGRFTYDSSNAASEVVEVVRLSLPVHSSCESL